MARHSARIRRLTVQVQTQQPDRRQARLAAMTDEGLEAEMANLAVRAGYPGNPAELTFAAASAWLDQPTPISSAAA